MDEFGEHLRHNGNAVALGDQLGEQTPCFGMMCVFRDFDSNQKTSVDAMRHSLRPSSISPSRSSSGDTGRRILPTLKRGKSSKLCFVACSF